MFCLWIFFISYGEVEYYMNEFFGINFYLIMKRPLAADECFD